jgi:hypothetical protein
VRSADFVDRADRAASSETHRDRDHISARSIIALPTFQDLKLCDRIFLSYTPQYCQKPFKIVRFHDIEMSSTLTFEIMYSLFHWMNGDIAPQVLAAKHRRTSSTVSVGSDMSSMSEGEEMQAFTERRASGVRHRRSSSETSGRSV